MTGRVQEIEASRSWLHVQSKLPLIAFTQVTLEAIRTRVM